MTLQDAVDFEGMVLKCLEFGGPVQPEPLRLHMPRYEPGGCNGAPSVIAMEGFWRCNEAPPVLRLSRGAVIGAAMEAVALKLFDRARCCHFEQRPGWLPGVVIWWSPMAPVLRSPKGAHAR